SCGGSTSSRSCCAPATASRRRSSASRRKSSSKPRGASTPGSSATASERRPADTRTSVPPPFPSNANRGQHRSSTPDYLSARKMGCMAPRHTHAPCGRCPPRDTRGVLDETVRLISRHFIAREMRSRAVSVGPEMGSDLECFSFQGKCATPPISFQKRGRDDLATVGKGCPWAPPGALPGGQHGQHTLGAERRPGRLPFLRPAASATLSLELPSP